MAEKNKFYVVWKGKKPGVYTSWEACKKQIQGEKGAQYMGFPSRGQAEMAYRSGYREAVANKKKAKSVSPEQRARLGQPNPNSVSVDAASSGNPGVMEYQGVDTRTRKRLFHQGPYKQGTNNIGEFLAIVHALAYLKKQGSNRIIYTDSRTAMSWVRKKKCNTKLEESEANRDLFDMVRRAVHWLDTNSYDTPVVKWETRAWGEIPADFGRK